MSSVSTPVPIAFCITDLDAGGAERALVRIVTELDRERWQPEVLCLSSPGELVEKLEAAEIPVTCFGARGTRNVGVVLRLARHLRKTRPVLLQTFLYHANITGRVAGKLARIPHILSGIRVAERRSRWRLRIDRWSEWMIEKHVCVSNGVAEFSTSQGGLNPKKIVTIPNGVDVEHFANASPTDLAKYEIPTGSRTVISVGRLDPQKDPQTLLDAFSRVAESSSNMHLLYVGDGPLRAQLESRVVAIGMKGRVHFTGRVGDVAPLLRAADVFALASKWEGMPNAVLEAMAAGLPVVTTAVEGNRELIDHRETGLLVPSESAADLADALREILSDRELASAIAETAQAGVSKQYTWCGIVGKYEQLYAEILAINTPEKTT